MQSGDGGPAAAEVLAAVVKVKEESVFEAVRRDVEALGEIRGAAAHVASALALARQIDSADVSAAAKASCARSLRETMDALRELAPKGGRVDGVDELNARRSQRRRVAS